MIDSADGESIVPEHAYLLFEDLKRGQEAMVGVNVKSSGKGSFVLVSPALGIELWERGTRNGGVARWCEVIRRWTGAGLWVGGSGR